MSVRSWLSSTLAKDSAAPLDGTEVLRMGRGGVSLRGLVSDIKDYVASALGLATTSIDNGLLRFDGLNGGTQGVPQITVDDDGSIESALSITGRGIINDYLSYPDFNSVAKFQYDSFVWSGFIFSAYGANSFGAWMEFHKSRTTDGDNFVVVQDGDEVMELRCLADATAGKQLSGYIRAVIDGAPGNFAPLRWEFFSRDTSGNAFIMALDSAGILKPLNADKNIGLGLSGRGFSHLTLGAYTVSNVPSAATRGAGTVIYVSNGDSGSPCLAVSDGVNWRRIALGANISSS